MRRTSRPSGSPVAARSAISCSSSSLRGARTGPCRRPRCLGAGRATGAKLLTARHGPLLPRVSMQSGRCAVGTRSYGLGRGTRRRARSVLGAPAQALGPRPETHADVLRGVGPGLNGHRPLVTFSVVARGLHVGRSPSPSSQDLSGVPSVGDGIFSHARRRGRPSGCC